MSDIYLVPLTGELGLKNNDLQIVTGRDAIRQDVKQTLALMYGEWFLDTTKGIPYLQQILVKGPDLTAIQGIFIDAILSVNGVLELLTLAFDYDNEVRLLKITFQARTTDGIINEEQILGAA